MLTLAATGTVQGLAGSGSAITYSLTGLDNGAAKVTQGVLTTGALPLWTAGAGTGSHISSIILCNTTAGSVTATLYINGTATANQFATIPVPANGEATFTTAGWVVTSAGGAVLFTIPLAGGTPTAETVGGSGSAGSTGLASDSGHAHAIAALTDGTHGSLGGGSDHAVAIAAGANGFLSGTDKTKLNNTSGTNTGDQTITLTSDVTGSGTGSFATTLKNTGPGATGPIGSATAVPVVTIDAQGRTTALTSTSIAIPESAVTNLTTDLAAKVSTSRLLNTTAPLTGGGDLSADRTLAITAATQSAAGAMAAADKKVVDDLWLDVRNFGIDPGNSAAANTTALNALVGASGTAPGGSTIYFPGGTYQFSSNVTVGPQTYSFVGVGNQITGGFTILEIVTGTSGLLTLTSGHWYTTFRNLTFVCGTTQTSGAMVTVNDNVSVNFYNCSFGSLSGTLFNGIDYTGTGAAANTTVVDTCFFAKFTNFGINVASDGASLVVVNTIMSGQWGTATQTAAACINVVNAGAVQIDNCDLIGATNNLLLNPTVGKVVASVYMTNSYMDNSNGSCLKISGAGATVRCRFIAVSFTTSNATTGLSAVEISTTVTAGAQGIDFENCSIMNTFSTTGTTNGFLITGAADFTIGSCRIAGWTNGINITPFNSAGKTQPVIMENTIGPTGGIATNTNGIVLNVGAVTYGDTIIQNNILSGNTTAAIVDGSTHTTTAAKIIGGNSGWMAGQGTLQPLSSGGAARINGRGAVTSSTTRTLLFTCRMPANSVGVGQTFLVRVAGQASAAATVTLDIASGANGTTADAALTSVASVVAGANGYVVLEGIATVVALGASSTVAASSYNVILSSVAGKAAAAEVINSTPTTAAWFLSVCGTATAGTFTVREAAVIAL